MHRREACRAAMMRWGLDGAVAASGVAACLAVGLLVRAAQRDTASAEIDPARPEGMPTALARGDRLFWSLASTSASESVTAGARTQVSLGVPVRTVSLAVRLHARPVPGAQVLLLRGDVTASDQAQLGWAFADGRYVGLAPWPDGGQPSPTFDALVPGRYNLCATATEGHVSCQPIVVAVSPARQAVELW